MPNGRRKVNVNPIQNTEVIDTGPNRPAIVRFTTEKQEIDIHLDDIDVKWLAECLHDIARERMKQAKQMLRVLRGDPPV